MVLQGFLSLFLAMRAQGTGEQETRPSLFACITGLAFARKNSDELKRVSKAYGGLPKVKIKAEEEFGLAEDAEQLLLVCFKS